MEGLRDRGKNARARTSTVKPFAGQYKLSSSSEVFKFTYSLQAVAVHDGPFRRGHYRSFVRDSADDWVHVNDEASPEVVPFEVVQREEAYLLVFHLLDAPADVAP